MIELKGKYNTCKVFTDNLEHSAISHIIAFLNQESLAGSKIRIMPDVHDGAGCVIGTTMTITDRVIPSVVGCDIGCGMLVVRLKEKRLNLPELDSVIRKYVDISRSEVSSSLKKVGLNDLKCGRDNVKAVGLGFGTLGGGNHFIEVDKDEESGDLYLIIHSGSRNLGIQIEKYYQNIAYDEAIARVNGGTFHDRAVELRDKLVANGKSREIENAMNKLKKEYSKIGDVPYSLAYVTGENLKNYLLDMEITQNYASESRNEMARIILKKCKLHEEDRFETVHNYIDIENMIVRKGSVSAQAGEKLLIPINMRDGSLICIGKGNEDWNYSAPHGAGRLFSRSDSKCLLTVSEFKTMMKEAGVFSTSVSHGTLSESPLAYKNMQEIVNNIAETAEVVKNIRPIYNYKSGGEEEDEE